MYYIFIEDNKLNGCGECQILNDGFFNLEVSEELYNSYKENPDMYIWDGNKVVVDPDYEEKQAQKERERLGMLFLTGADVERGIYQAKGMDFDDIMAFVMANPPKGLDVKALKIELKANNFYRGNPYVNAVGALLGFTEEQLDKFFETKDYKYLTTCTLIVNAVPTEATVEGAGAYPYGTVIDVIVECEGYTGYTETVTLTEDKTLNIELKPVEE